MYNKILKCLKIIAGYRGLNKSPIGASIDGKRINHMLYADDLFIQCIVSLSSAGLQQLLSICDQYCSMHSITFNVKIYVCMFFRCSMNKACDITNVVLSGNIIDYNNNNNIFIHTCYNCIEQYIPINNNILRIIKHVMLNI